MSLNGRTQFAADDLIRAPWVFPNDLGDTDTSFHGTVWAEFAHLMDREEMLWPGACLTCDGFTCIFEE